MKENPYNLPWEVKYDKMFPERDPKSRPHVVNCKGETVCPMMQYVKHPGEYDEQADRIALLIATSANMMYAATFPVEQINDALRRLGTDD
jgi:hypothetical protein